MITVPCGLVVIRYWPDVDYLDTYWDEDHKVPSIPNYRDEDLALAAELGYGVGREAVRACWVEHDPLHSFLSVAQGLDYSPTLHSVAWGYKPPRGIIPAEEADVLALQKYLCTTVLDARLGLLAARCGCTLPDLAERARAWLAQFGC